MITFCVNVGDGTGGNQTGGDDSDESVDFPDLGLLDISTYPGYVRILLKVLNFFGVIDLSNFTKLSEFADKIIFLKELIQSNGANVIAAAEEKVQDA